MHDGAVVAACLDSGDAYRRISDHVDSSEFTPMAAFWWGLIADWYRIDPGAQRVDRAILRQRGRDKASEKHGDTLLGWFDDLPTAGSPANVVRALIEVKRHAKSNELFAAETSGAPAEAVRKLAREYSELLDAESFETNEPVPDRVEDGSDLLRTVDSEGRYKLLPLALNSHLEAGVGGGDHIILFGPTEIGKSCMAINMVSGFLRQGAKVVYGTNEDAGWKFLRRARGNLAHMTGPEMMADPQTAVEKSKALGIDNLFVYQLTPGNARELEGLVEEHDADVVVIDQIRNLKALESNAKDITRRMDQAAQEVRAMLLRREVIGISMAQAYAGEHGKPTVWYNADDIDSSRVGLSASGDLVIGIGADEDMLSMNRRALSICKNKLGDEKRGLIVEFDLRHSKVTSL